jgi:hypothetical protein
MEAGSENKTLSPELKEGCKKLLKQQVIFTFLMVSLGVVITILIVKKVPK